MRRRATGDAISALALADNGTCLIGTRAGRCKTKTGDRDWHDIALPGAGVVAGLHFTWSGSLFAVRIVARSEDEPRFSAEVWHATTLAQPDPNRTVWRMVIGSDNLNTALANLAAGEDRATLAAQNTIAQAHIPEEQLIISLPDTAPP